MATQDIQVVGSVINGSAANPTSGNFDPSSIAWVKDDYLICVWYSRDSKTFTKPASITQKVDTQVAATGHLFIGYRKLVAGDTTHAWTAGTSTNNTTLWGCFVVRNVYGSGDPFEAVSDAGATTITNAQNMDPPAVTTVMANALVTAFFGKNNDYAASITKPTNYTDSATAHAEETSGTDGSFGWAWRTIASGGTNENPGVFTLGGASTDDGLTWTGSLRPKQLSTFTLDAIAKKNRKSFAFVNDNNVYSLTGVDVDVPLPTGWQPGDLAIAIGYQELDEISSITAPSGWTSISSSTISRAYRIAYRYLQSGDTNAGTESQWGGLSNLSDILIVVFRGARYSQIATASGTGTTITIPALTLLDTDGSSTVLAFVIGSNLTHSTSGGMTHIPPGAVDIDGFYQYGPTSWPSQTTSTSNQAWRGFSIEVAGEGFRSPTLDAIVKKNISGSFTADSIVRKKITGSFTLDAIVKKTIIKGVNLTAYDTFTEGSLVRVPSHTANIGGQWDGPVEDVGVTAGGLVKTRAFLDGSGGNDLYRLPTAQVGDLDIYFDTYFNANSASDDSITMGRATALSGDYRVYGVRRTATGSAGEIELVRWTNSDAIVIAAVATPDNATLRHVHLQIVGASPTTLRVRTWTGPTEPSTWDIDTTDNTALYQVTTGYPAMMSYYDVLIENSAFVDNLSIYSVSGGIAADAVIAAAPETGGNFAADAVIRKNQAASFTADAVLKKSITATFTTDAVLKRNIPASFTAEGIVKKDTSLSYTTDAVIKRSQSAGLTADAVVKRSQAATFTANAVLKRTIGGSFAEDAVIKRSQASSATADAVVRRSQAATFSADAYLLRRVTAAATADAVLKKTIAASFSANAIIKKTIRGNPYSALILGHSNIRGYYRLDEPVGTDIKDATGNSGAIAATVLRTRQGLVGGDADTAIGFDGTDMFVAGSNASLPYGANSSFSIEFLVKLGAASSHYFLVGFAETFGIRALIRYNGHIYFWGDGNDIETGTDYGTGIAHIAVTYNGTTMRFYKNGAEVYNASPPFSIVAGGGGWAIGKKGFHGATFMDALPNNTTIDEVALYNDVITPSQVLTHYLASLGSLQADAVIRRVQAGSFTTNAVIKRNQAAALTADAILRRAVSATTTADATIRRVIASSFSADGILKKDISSSTTANAVVRRVQAATFDAAAVIFKRQSASVPADAIIRRAVGGGLTADAIVKRTGVAAPTADAVLKKTQGASFTANAWIAGVNVFGFAADAVLKKTQGASATADALLRLTGTAQITADATIKSTVSAALSANAVIKGTVAAGSSANAVLRAQRAATFFADAVLKKSIAGSATADGVLRATRAASCALDAVLRVTRTQQFTADAVLKRAISGSFSADAYIISLAAGGGSFTGNAVIKRSQPATLTADALIRRNVNSQIAANAVLLRRTLVSFTADAICSKKQSATAAANAVVRSGRTSAFTSDAYLVVRVTGSWTAEAAILAPRSSSLPANAILSRTATATVTADAFVRLSTESAFTADAALLAARQGAFITQAIVRAPITQSFTASAVITIPRAPVTATTSIPQMVATTTISSINATVTVSAIAATTVLDVPGGFDD